MSEDRAELVAQLRDEYGDTMTRKQMLAYTEKTGTNLRFLRRPEMKTAPGVFRLPGAAAAPAPVPVKDEPKRKAARKKSAASMPMEREVLAAPYLQDEDYDEPVADEPDEDAPEDETPTAAPKRKKGRKSVSDGFTVLSVGKSDFVSAWTCSAWGCRGRDVDTPTDGAHDPRCPECGSIMNVHHYVPTSVIRAKRKGATA